MTEIFSHLIEAERPSDTVVTCYLPCDEDSSTSLPSLNISHQD